MPGKDTLHSFLETLSGPDKSVFEFLLHLDQKENHHSSTEQVFVSWGERDNGKSTGQMMHMMAHEGSVKSLNGTALSWIEIHQGDHQNLAVGSSHLRVIFDENGIILHNSAGSMRGMAESCGKAFSETAVPVAVTESSGEVVYSNDAYKKLFG